MMIAQSISSEFPNFTKIVGYQSCDREQIHLLGHIQPHGVLIGINESELKIVQISENTNHFFNVPATSFINQPLNTLFPKSQIDILISFIYRKNLEVFNPIKITVKIKRKKYFFEGIMHRSNGLLILELEPLSKECNSSLGFYHLAKSAAINVRGAKNFDEMSELLVKEVRGITGFDRVLIYKFDMDNSGFVIAENKADSLEPLLGLHYPAFDIPEIPRKLYCKNWLRLIADVNYQPVPIIPPNNPLTQEMLDLSYSRLRSVSQSHIKYLQKMGVSASFSISLINGEKLWGLIACHHYAPKYIDYETRKTCEFLGQIMSIEIVNKHDQYVRNSQEKIKDTQSKLKQSILEGYQSINNTFTQDSKDLLDLVNAQGVVISLGDRIAEIGLCPSKTFVASLLVWLEKKAENIFHTNCLSEVYPEAIAIKDVASGLLAISISLNYTAYHIVWFRGEVVQTVNWAGDPSKLLDIDDIDTDPSPRRSFELWKETVRAKSLPWSEVEIEAASDLRSTLMLSALEFSQQSLKQEAERSQIASQAKTKFLARMSHELRTPLNAILGCTQLMHSEDSEKHEFNEYVDIISHSSEHLLNLIDDVLEMSKIEAGKVILETTKFDFCQFLNRLKEMLQVKAKEKNLQIIFVIHPSLPQYIEADERKIRQVLLNLIGNAIKFTDKGYIMLRVSLGTSNLLSPALAIHFEIEDTGRGIAPEEIDKLFEAFVQTASGRATQTGTGLSLVISQQFVHFMGGNITVNSTWGKGTIFQFDIIANDLSNQKVEIAKVEIAKVEINRRTDFASPSVVVKDKKSMQDSSNCLRILLVEDNQFNQMIALRLLVKLGYKADCAMNGIEVLKALEHKSYDLILMDIQMPEMDGLEATRRIRLLEKESDSSNRVVIVAMTANAMSEDRENCFAIGMDDFISKPVRIEYLAEILKKYKL